MLRILIVEDNETDFLLLSRQIKMTLTDPVCTRAESRAELRSFLADSWDLIITDFHLLDIEGGELINTIATAQPRTPCLVMSGSVEQLQHISMPENVFARVEKGDHSTLKAALLGGWTSS